MTTPWEVIKRNANKAQQDKVRAEAERASLEREEERILARIRETTGKDLKTVDELKAEKEALTAKVTEAMRDMAKALDEVDYLSDADREILESKGVL